MIASPVSSSPSARPSSATSSARTARPTRAARAPVDSQHQAHPGQHREQRRRPAAGQPLGRVSVPSGLRSSSTCAATMPSSARQRATSRPTSLATRPRWRQNPSLPGPGVVADRRALGLRGLLERGLELDHPLAQPLVGRGQDAHREQPRVARVADRDRRDRHAGRHLDDRQQRVEAVEVLEGDGYADHRQRRHRGEHPGQVGRSPGAGDDHPEPATRRLLAVGQHLLRHPVRRDDVGLERHVELLQRLRGSLHHRPVGVGAHHDPDQGAHVVPVISKSLALVAEVAAEPGGGVPGALEAVLEVVTVGVDVADLAAGPQLLAVEVHPQLRVASQGVRVAVVQPARPGPTGRPGC